MGPHKKISCINFHVHQIRSHIWHGKPSTTSMGQLFLLLLFKKKNLFRLQLIKVRENCGIAMFLTVVNKSCKCDLSQRGVPYMDAERLYLEIRCNMLCSVICGYCCWICLISLSSHIFEDLFMKWKDWHTYNKYNVYKVKRKNNESMRCFKYSKNVNHPSYALCPCENYNGNDAFSSVSPYYSIFIVSVRKTIGSLGIPASSTSSW